MKKFLFFVCILVMVSGCGFFDKPHQMEKNAEQLAAEGASAFIEQDYNTAKEAYSSLKDWYPFSRYAILAELKIADSHFYLEEYDEAILAYEEFERMHPKNEAVPYVIYQTGMAWFNRLGTVDRDDMPAKKALAQFNRLADQFPDSEYAKKGKKNFATCLKHLSGHELYVADFYMRTKKYKAALARYEYLIEHYPDSEEAKTALNKISRARELAQKE